MYIIKIKNHKKIFKKGFVFSNEKEKTNGASGIRTHAIRESNSLALPLGYSPMFIKHDMLYTKSTFIYNREKDLMDRNKQNKHRLFGV